MAQRKPLPSWYLARRAEVIRRQFEQQRTAQPVLRIVKDAA